MFAASLLSAAPAKALEKKGNTEREGAQDNHGAKQHTTPAYMVWFPYPPSNTFTNPPTSSQVSQLRPPSASSLPPKKSPRQNMSWNRYRGPIRLGRWLSGCKSSSREVASPKPFEFGRNLVEGHSSPENEHDLGATVGS